LKALDDTKTDRMKELADEAGFAPIPKNHPGAVWLRIEHLKRRALKIEDEYLAYQKLIEEDVADYEDQTPQVVERLLRGIRDECGVVVSASVTCDPNDRSDLALILQDRLDDLVAELRRRTAEDPGNLGALETLVSILAQKGDLEEARAQAELATRVGPARAGLWSTLGMVELELERLEEAASACERALEIDPLDRLGLIILAGVYPKLGREAEASELRNRLQTFGPVA
jgi:tetratricopeptide (TPR) repeat protein